MNTLTGSHGLIEAMYPRYQDWQAIHAELNSSGVFDSPVQQACGDLGVSWGGSVAGTRRCLAWLSTAVGSVGRASRTCNSRPLSP